MATVLPSSGSGSFKGPRVPESSVFAAAAIGTGVASRTPGPISRGKPGIGRGL